jgi:diadenosine tetraphosphate (Ap4A) HIT family hydrolase
MRQSTCELCNAIMDSESNPNKLYNTKLLENEEFIVLPCIGPIILGQVMIVSKLHYSNLASMGNQDIEAYSRLINRIKKTNPLYNKELLEIEHGATETDNAGACIVHAHVHLVPNFGKHEEVFDDKLEEIMITDNIQEITKIKRSYILVRGMKGYVRIYSATNLPSQFVRRIIFGIVNRNDWNWQIYPYYELISETINFWSKSNIK